MDRLSSTGSHAVVGTSDGYATMIEIATGNEDGRFQTPQHLQRMVVAPDDGSIAVLHDYRDIRIYQADGVLLKQFSGTRALNGIAWCPESDCLLAWGSSGLLEVWDPFKPELVDSLRGHAREMRVAAFSPMESALPAAATTSRCSSGTPPNGKRAGSLGGLKVRRRQWPGAAMERGCWSTPRSKAGVRVDLGQAPADRHEPQRYGNT
jgi:WD40 repeat protein